MSTRKASKTGGVPAFSISGRMVSQRERLTGMTDEERRWRAQYLKDQKLDPDEPRFSPELFKATNNIFRRIARYPLDTFQKLLTPVLGAKGAAYFRKEVRMMSIFAATCLLIKYYVTYNAQDWTRNGGWYISKTRIATFPGDTDYPNVPEKKPYEYCDLGFSKTFFFEEINKK